MDKLAGHSAAGTGAQLRSQSDPGRVTEDGDLHGGSLFQKPSDGSNQVMCCTIVCSTQRELEVREGAGEVCAIETFTGPSSP